MDYNMFSDISPNAKYLLNPVDSILELYDLNTNNIIRSVNIKKVANGFYPAIYPKISDNGICVFNSDNVLYVYDIFNDNLIATKNISQAWVKVSPNGKYISVDKTDSLKIYRINENSVSFQSGLKKSIGLIYSGIYDFLPDQEDYLYLYETPFIYVRSCQDLSIIRSMNIGSDFFNIDFCSNKILTAKDAGNWNIYDFNTGNLLQTINTYPGPGASNYTLLTNNTIYYSGYKYFLIN
jgi:WD40 repeat protein